MKNKQKISILLSVILLVLTIPGPTYGEQIESGFVEGTGTYFEIRDRDYLNITLDSSEEVKLRMESVPEMIMMIFEKTPAITSNLSQITISGLDPLTIYYKYEDDYHNKIIFTTDQYGAYTYFQDLSETHFVFIQPRTSTIFIADNATGGDCHLIGAWDQNTKTCTLTTDVDETIQIDSDDIILDGGGHSMTGTNTGHGLYLSYRSGVTIRSLNISNFSAGATLLSSTDNILEHLNISDSGGRGIHLYFGNFGSDRNTIRENLVLNSGNYGIRIYGSDHNLVDGNIFRNSTACGIDIFSSHYNTVTNNTTEYGQCGIVVQSAQNNVFYDNTILNSSNVGIGGAYDSNNQFYNNNFIDNAQSVRFLYSGANIFNLPAPTGGNYFSDYDTPAEGCDDTNSDGFCDAPYVFPGGQDNLPWTTQDGWETPPSLPDISITSQPLEFFNDAAPYMPNVLKIKARVLNKGNGAAEHVVVNFTLDGAPIVGGSVDLGSIESLQDKNAEIEWAASSNIENATVEATVELIGQEDGDPSDNAISQLISFYFVPFRHDVDAFSFENWGLQTWDDYLDEFNDFLVAQTEERDIATFIAASIGGPLFTLLGKKGHCYGMATAGTSYYIWPRIKPVNENTFSMTPAEAKPDIIERHWEQLLHIWNPLIEMWKENIPYDAGHQYDEIVDYIKSLSMPVPLVLRDKTGGGGHSVVAYKILELGDDDKRVFVYDNNMPYDDPSDAYSPPPNNRKDKDYYIIFKPLSNAACYWNKYDRAFAIEPWEIIGSEELIASIQEALSSAFSWLREKGRILLRLKSPVTCLLTDQFGRRIGYVDSTFINEIPGAEMANQLDSQLFYLPADLTYAVEMTGTAMGELGIDIVIPTSESSARIVLFENIRVSLDTEAMSILDTIDLSYEVVLDAVEVVEPVSVGEINASDIFHPTSVSTLMWNTDLYYAMGWLKNVDIRNGLLDKLYAAQEALNRGQIMVAKRILKAFILQTQSDINVDDRARQYLSAYAQYMIGKL